MKVLRAFLTGWPALLGFLITPSLAMLLSSSDDGEWKRWLLVAPFLVAYLWFTWPQRPNASD